jgi:NADP-dependent 3-hydroxy acid dehydrogenase YdfG
MQKVVMISGGTRGIGLATARELLQHGWHVSVGARSQSHAFNSYSSSQVLVSRFDAQQPVSEDEWVASTLQHFGRIDAIVHNAGILSRSSVIDATSAEFDQIFDINVKSPMRLTQKVWPHLVASGQGKVIVMASLAGKRIRAPEATLYAMSKFAVLALAHGIRHCGEASNVRATAICPGFVATDMAAGVPAEQLAKLTQPEDIARIVRLALELPFSASVAEIPVSWTVEPQY